MTADHRPPIDLLHCGGAHRVGCYVVETEAGLALFDCGPATTLPTLEAGLVARGLSFDEIDHLLLSHIHLDHAGAAGAIVRAYPHIQVHVSPIGEPHLIDPSRLELSARRLYGDAFDDLWGALVPIPEENVSTVGDTVLGLEVFPSPGHASHHVSYLHRDGTLYCGDAAGVRVAPGRFVLPPLAPPEIDLEAWEQTIVETERRAPTRLALVHFGVFDDVQGHLQRLRETIERWAAWVGHGMDEATFCAAAAADAAESDPATAAQLGLIVPYAHCHAGLSRYWQKRSER